MVRDNALAVSGLLVAELGGASVKPYQPAGYYRHLNFPTRKYEHAHRRAAMAARRLRALAAPVPASDAEGVRCAQPRGMHRAAAALQHAAGGAGAAERSDVRRSGPRLCGADPERRRRHRRIARLDFAFRSALLASPTHEEQQLLVELLDNDRSEYRADADRRAKHLLEDRDRADARRPRSVELAAWTAVARAILNLNETDDAKLKR